MPYLLPPELVAIHSGYVRKVEETKMRMQMLARRAPAPRDEYRNVKNTVKAQLIIDFANPKTFYFKTKELVQDDLDSMESVRDMKSQHGLKEFRANPYHTKIGDLMLYDSSTQMYRCKILDIYPVAIDEVLKMCVTIKLVDSARYLFNISLEKSIYNYPPLMTKIKLKEPECKLAQLIFAHRLPSYLNNANVRNSFVEWFNFVNFNLDAILIQIYGKMDETYLVDVVKQWNNQSLVGTLKRKHPQTYLALYAKHMKELRLKQQLLNPLENLFSLPRIAKLEKRIYSRRNFSNPDPSFSSAYLYFKTRLDQIEGKSVLGGYRLKRSLFKVTLLCWNDPNSIYIIPTDPSYIESHVRFRSKLDRLYNNHDQASLVKKQWSYYRPNDFCVFKNDIDPKLGKWLRGSILVSPKLGKCGFWVLTDEKNLVGDIGNTTGEDVYLVQSIDFGFRCVRPKTDIFPILDRRLYFEKGAWSMRCRLFGIGPLDERVSSSYVGPGLFSSTCIDLMDIWIRSKLANKFNQASILFRSNLKSIQENLAAPLNKSPYITLFFREERQDYYQEMGPNQNRFECLNEYLVDEGEASSLDQISMDTHTINYLVDEDLM